MRLVLADGSEANWPPPSLKTACVPGLALLLHLFLCPEKCSDEPVRGGERSQIIPSLLGNQGRSAKSQQIPAILSKLSHNHRDSPANSQTRGLNKCSVQFSCSVMPNSLQPHRLQHARPPSHCQLLEFTQTHVH